MKNVSDLQVVQAYIDCKKQPSNLPPEQHKWPYDLLVDRTGECEKVCYRAMERACLRDYIEYGVSLRAGWVTDKGHALLEATKAKEGEA